MHGNLEPDEDVLDWDIEEIKRSYKEGAKDYDRIIKQIQDEKEENDKWLSVTIKLNLQVVWISLFILKMDALIAQKWYRC